METPDFSQFETFLASVTERDLYVSFNVPANDPVPVRTMIPASLFLEMAKVLESAAAQNDRSRRVTLIDLGAEHALLGRPFTSHLVGEELFNEISELLSSHLRTALA